MKTIPLTRGYFTKVDDEDYEKFASIRWQAMVDSRSKMVRASRKGGNPRTTIYLSREIMNAPKGKLVDHVNGNQLDNQKQNLRLCTHAENLQNRGPTKSNTSGFKGVCFDKNLKKWRAQIGFKMKRRYIGSFNTKKEAALAYDRFTRKLHGKFAKPNLLI